MDSLMSSSRQSFWSYLKLVLKGFCMGACDVVPGVSGGTMAFILGIYEELIAAIRSFDLTFFKQLLLLRPKQAFRGVALPFLLPLGLGIFSAIFTLSKGLAWLLANRPILIWSFFFGLIVASIFVVQSYIRHWRGVHIAWAFCGAVCTYWLVGVTPTSTPEAYWFLFLSGAIAICAMILPGISGSFILVLLGKYHYILAAVNHHDFITLFVVAAGAAVGLFTFVRVIDWLFKRHHDIVIALLTGLMVGSLRKVWPWKYSVEVVKTLPAKVLQINGLPVSWNLETLSALGLVVLGVAVVLCMNSLVRVER